MKSLEWGPLVGVSLLLGIVIALSVSLPIVYRNKARPLLDEAMPVARRALKRNTPAAEHVLKSALHSEFMSGGRMFIVHDAVQEKVIKTKPSARVVGVVGKHSIPHISLTLGTLQNLQTHAIGQLQYAFPVKAPYFFEYSAHTNVYVWTWLSQDGNAIYLAHSKPNSEGEWVIKNIGLSRTVSRLHYANHTACVDEMCMHFNNALDEYVWLPAHSLRTSLPFALPNGNILYWDAMHQQVGVQHVHDIDWKSLRVTLYQSIYKNVMLPSNTRIEAVHSSNASDSSISFITHANSQGHFHYVVPSLHESLQVKPCAGVQYLGMGHASIISYSCGGNMQMLYNVRTNRIVSYNTLEHAIRIMHAPFAISPTAVPQ